MVHLCVGCRTGGQQVRGGVPRPLKMPYSSTAGAQAFSSSRDCMIVLCALPGLFNCQCSKRVVRRALTLRYHARHMHTVDNRCRRPGCLIRRRDLFLFTGRKPRSVVFHVEQQGIELRLNDSERLCRFWPWIRRRYGKNFVC